MIRPHRLMPLQARVTAADAVAPADADAWRAMAQATPEFASPLLGPEFAALVARVRDDVRVAVFSCEGEVVGVLAHHRRPGGVARALGAPWSDAHALLTWPERAPGWREALAAAGLRCFRFSHLVDPHGVFADVVDATAPGHVLATQADGAAAWERLRAGSPKRFKNLRRLEHKLERELGPLVLASDRSPESLSRLIGWKRAQFARTGAHDVLHPAWSQALMQAAFAFDTPRLRGELLALRAGGRLVAAHFGVRDGATFHPWLAGYDPELAAYSPGAVFLSQLVRTPLGLARCELSEGGDDYKAVFADRSELTASGVADLRGPRRPSRFPLVRKLHSRLDFIAEADITLADRLHGVAHAALDAPRLMRRMAPAQELAR